MLPAATSTAGASLLIVDDELANIAFLERLLARAGYLDLRSTSRSDSVLSLCQDRMPDLVLLDLHMPVLDGLAVIAQLRTLNAVIQPYVIILTGDTSAEMRTSALAGGARDFIAKPFDITEVLLRIGNLLDLRLMAGQLRTQNQMLSASVAARTLELEEARLEVIERLALTAEMRDDLTGQHTRRVGELAAAIAAALEQPADEIETIRRAAPLHDIGKIAIPDRILLKRGRLTTGEFAVMKTHTAVGARILADSQSPLLQCARDIALCHHERWDGEGYPRRLAGAQIPLPARIVAVADFFDALSNDRPYRTAVPGAEVRALIAAAAGAHFDPDVVQAFSRAH